MAIFGAGFAGSILALVLRQLGYSVALLEKGRHPRFAIGESSTPFANLLLEKLAADFDLPFLRHFSEWGLWQTHHPEIAAGLKRGFSFFHHTPGQALDLLDRDRQLLVAASPNDRVADTHWFRPEFDHFLAQQAVARGVRYCDDFALDLCARGAGGWEVAGRSRSTPVRLRAGFLVDAAGASSPISPALSLEESAFPNLPGASSVYAHFRNVQRLDEHEAAWRGLALPYPPDDAAVHHLFPGGWIWVLRFNNGLTSAGAALTDPADRTAAAVNPGKLWHDLLGRFPTLAGLFRDAIPATPFFHLPKISFRRTQAFGPGWVRLPSATAFVDPLLSTGFALTLRGIDRLGAIFREKAQPSADDLAPYQTATFAEVDAAADLVSALYARMDDFATFRSLTLLYFAALSYTETAWRLGRAERADRFLLAGHPSFSSARTALCAAARRRDTTTVLERRAFEQAIQPFDLAGLTDWSRNFWYPADPNDLVRSAALLGCGADEIEGLLRKMGVAESAPSTVAG